MTPKSSTFASAERRLEDGLPRSQILRAAAAAVPAILCSRPSPADAAIMEEDTAERVYDAAAPSVVAIHTRSQKGDQDGLGSGIIWDRLGHLVTNYHVVQVLKRDV